MPPRKNKLPDLLPEGWIMTDTSKKSWRLGKKLGQGGFGLIYLASPVCDKPVCEDTAYVIKVENHQNGPLFCELKFYQRAAKQDDVMKWIQNHKLDYLGIPRYWGSGETTFNSISYRFMVIDRLGSDLQNLQKNNSGRLPLQTVLQVGVRMVYLADYGLSYRYCPDGKHKEYKEDPRKCHNGTLEFTSLDAHKGAAPSRRGDLEILSFCMLHWLSGRLPWDQDLKVPSTVQAAKQKLMDGVPNSVTAWLGREDGCNDIAKFMVEVSTLSYSVKPNYKGLKGILLKALESAGTRLNSLLIFSNRSSTLRGPTVTKTKVEVVKPHQNKVNEGEGHRIQPKSFNSPKPHQLQKTPKQVKKTNGVDLINGHDKYQTHFVGSDNYGKSSKVQRTRLLDFPAKVVGVHEPTEKVNVHSIQNYKPAGRNPSCHIGKTYWQDGECSYQDQERKSLLEEPNSQHQHRRDIYKYGLAIPVLLLMIYCAIYGL